nr:uncharacterized protein LOC123763136 isoform X2 [Procambarus clarkii]
MHGHISRDDDSGSDWDSISEMAPPPPKKQESQISARGQSQDQLAAVPRKLKSLTHVDPHLGSKQASENPPFSFRSEIKSPVRVLSEHTAKPGKQKKGKLYDPRPPSQRRVSFVEEDSFDQDKPSANGGMIGTDSDIEDPLYSTVKPKEANNPDHIEPPVEKGNEDEIIHESKRKKSLIFSKSLHKKLQGIDNKGFIEDNEAADKKSTNSSPVYAKPHTLGNQRLPPKLPQDRNRCQQGLKHDTCHTMPNPENSLLVNQEWSPPLILTAGETSLESAGKKSVEAVNRAMGEAFALITFPFTCFTLFLHHLIRFFLQGVLRPLLVEPLTLIVEYLLHPIMSGVLRPLLITVHGVSLYFSDIIVVCLRPLTTVLQSFR